MRVLLLVTFFIGLAACGEVLFESTEDLFKKWSKFKAMETCFGDQVTRNFMLKMKKAHAKCANQPLPVETELDVSQSTSKLVRALLDGSAKVEKENVAKLKDALGMQASPSFGFPYFLPYQAPKRDDDEDFMSEMMKKVFAKKLMKQMEKLVDEDQNADKKFRKRRDEPTAEAAPAIPAAPQDIFDLGDRLNAKIAQEKAGFGSKLGNYSCILQELNFVDKDNEINIEGVLEGLSSSGIENEWLLNQLKKDKKLCYERVQALPEDVLNSCVIGPKWMKIKEFMCCCKESKMRTCMAFDTKQKLEANFGGLDKLLTQTGLTEKELLGMAARVVFGSMDFD